MRIFFSPKRNINYSWTYDLYGPICNVFDRGKSIKRAMEGLVRESQDIFGPKSQTFMAQPFQWPNNGFAQIKNITYRAVLIRGP